MLLDIAPVGRRADAPSADEVLDSCREQDVQFINLQFTDVMGMVKSVTIPVRPVRGRDRPRQVVRRLVDRGLRPHRRERHVPRCPTWPPSPSSPGSAARTRPRASSAGSTSPNGELFPGDPRARAAARSWSEARRWATRYNTGPELEFFLFRPKEGDGSRRCRTTEAGYFDFSTDLAGDVRKEMVQRARGDGHQGRDQPPRGRHRPARDRLRVRRRAAHGRQRRHLQVHAQGDRAAARPARHLHAQADRSASTARACTRTRACWPTRRPDNAFVDADDDYGLSDAGQAVHRRAARARARHDAPCWRRWSTRTSGWCRATRRRSTSRWARVNRSALIRVPRDPRRQAARDAHRAALPRPVLQPLPGLRGHAARPAWTASSASCRCPSRSRRTSTTSRADDLARRNIARCPRHARRGARGAGARRGRPRRAGRARLRAPDRSPARRLGPRSASTSRSGSASGIWRCIRTAGPRTGPHHDSANPASSRMRESTS